MNDNIFTIEQLSFTYAGEEKPALKNISVEIKEGGFYVLCGRSGCGKSTLLRHLKSVLTPHGKKEGSIRYRGTDLGKVPESVQSREIGFVFQEPDDQIVTDEVWHELAFGLENLGYPGGEIHLRMAEMVSYFGMESWFERKIPELSGGQKQMLNLASVLVLQPKVLILDEPMAQLDPKAAEDFFYTLLKLHSDMGMTLILSEHDLERIFSFAEQIFVMENGTFLAEGTPDQIGKRLAGENHEMFLAMPTPLRISAWCGETKCLPYTVAEGRRWLKQKAAINEAEEQDGKKENVPAKSFFLKKNRDTVRTHVAIDISRVWFRYGKEEPYILKELSLQIYRGEVFALLGGNGTGKSTLLRVISGFLPLARGKIKIGEQRDAHGTLGILPQEPSVLFVKDTLLEDLMEVSEKEAVLRMAEQMDLTGLLKKHPYDLSGGERQKAALAKVLLKSPRMLLLDEPTKSLDAYDKKKMGEFLRSLTEDGMTILLVSHDVDFCAHYADRAGLCFQGKVEAVGDRISFFAGHHFYTTAANRLAGEIYPDVITAEEVVEKLGK